MAGEKPYFSIIIPVYNRPDEVRELLESLVGQTCKDFELLLVEDGSTRRCNEVAGEYSDRLTIRYFYKENSGRSLTRNYGMERAEGRYLVFFDSDCIIPPSYFETVRRLLDAEKVPYVINHRLVRGLDYYTRTTFEIVSDQIGAQGTVAGGGRYDGLVEQLGGPNVSGLGFACGMERLALLLPQPEAGADRPDFFTVVLTDVARDAAYALTQALRDAGFRGEMGFSSRSIKSAMRQAGKSGARFCLLIGEDELAAQTVMLKNMDSGEQSSVAFADVVARLQK